MAVLSSDLIEPNGPILAVMFPALTTAELSTRVTSYIASAATQSRITALDPSLTDAATSLYATYLAYDDVVTRMSAEPFKFDLADQGSREYVIQQLKEFQAKRDSIQQQYLALTTPAASPVDAGYSRDSHFIPTQVVW